MVQIKAWRRLGDKPLSEPMWTQFTDVICAALDELINQTGPCHLGCHSAAFPGDTILALHWRHNDHDGVSNHQPHGCLLNRLFRRRSKKTSKLRVTGLCVGNSPGPVNSPHKGPVTRKMFPFDDVIMVRNHVVKSQRTVVPLLSCPDANFVVPGGIIFLLLQLLQPSIAYYID